MKSNILHSVLLLLNSVALVYSSYLIGVSIVEEKGIGYFKSNSAQ